MDNHEEILKKKIEILNGERQKRIEPNLTEDFQEKFYVFQQKILSLDEKFGKFSPDEITNYLKITKGLVAQNYVLEKKITDHIGNQDLINKYLAEVKSSIENIETKFKKMEEKIGEIQPFIDRTLTMMENNLNKFEKWVQEFKMKVNNYYTKMDLDEKMKEKVDLSQVNIEIDKSISNRKILNKMVNEMQNPNGYVIRFIKRYMDYRIRTALESFNKTMESAPPMNLD